MNSPELGAKISDRNGNSRRWAQADAQADELVEAIYLTMLARMPTDAERKLMSDALVAAQSDQQAAQSDQQAAQSDQQAAQSDRQAVIEDIMWALMNSKEFLYNH